MLTYYYGVGFRLKLNIDSRFSECGKTQLTGSHPSLLGCGEGKEIFFPLKRTLSSEMSLKMLFFWFVFLSLELTF